MIWYFAGNFMGGLLLSTALYVRLHVTRPTNIGIHTRTWGRRLFLKLKDNSFLGSGMGLSTEGVEFYHDVWKKWKTISSGNKFDVWKQLEVGWDEFAKENTFGCVAYSGTKRDGLNDSCNRTACENQKRGLPANHFSLNREEHFEQNKPWKKKRTLLSSNDMMKIARTVVLTRKQGGQLGILSLAEIASPLSVKTEAVLCILKSEDEDIQQAHDNN